MSRGRGRVQYDAHIFDVQGTLMDFYTPVAEALARYTTADVQVGDIVRAWRRDYFERESDLKQSTDEWHSVQGAYVDGLAKVCVDLDISIPGDLRQCGDHRRCTSGRAAISASNPPGRRWSQRIRTTSVRPARWGWVADIRDLP